MNCVECDEDGEITLATQVIHAPWGRMDLCEKHYDQAGERGAGREPDYGAVGLVELQDRARGR